MPITGKGVLRVAIDDFIKDNPLGKSIKGWVVSVIEMLEKAVFGEYKSHFDRLNKTPGLEGMFDTAKMTAESGLHQGGIFSGVGFANALGSSAASTLFGPYFRLLNYEIDKNLHTTRLDPSAAIAGFWRDPSKEAMLADDLGCLGWNKERVEVLTKLMRNRLNQTELVACMLRGLISEADFTAELRARGYLDADISQIIKLAHGIPPVQDLISMAVREAWNDQTSARFKYDEGLPAEAANEAAKLGLDPIWFKRYWRAHWNLISPTQGYQMLHRLRPGTTDKPFTVDDMRMLLTAADYPEFFRDRLIEVSYNPLTRVDVRRMYGEGVLSEDEVLQAYLDLGYDQENAKRLQQFTIKYESADEDTVNAKKKKLTISTFLQGFEYGVIDENTLRERLAGIPLSAVDIDFEVNIAKIKKSSAASVNYQAEYNRDIKSIVEREYSVRFIDKASAEKLLSSIGMSGEDITKCLELVDYKYNANVIDEVLGVVREGYLTGSIDFQTVTAVMGKIGLSGASQENFISTWNIIKDLRVKSLTEPQLRAAYKKGVITAEAYRNGLVKLMYTNDAIDILVKLYTGSSDESEV